MDTRNYNRRYAKEYGLGRSIFYRWFLYFVVLPVSCLQYTIKIVGKENLKKGEKYLYAGNHTSYLDPPFVALAANKKVAFMAKQELFTDKNGLLRFKTVLELLKTDWSLGIFPEGKTSQSHILENVQKGFTLIAKKAKADVVPIGIKGFDGYAGKSLFKKHITITIGKPISYELPPEEILKQWAEQICEYTGYENRIGQEQEVSQ